MTSHYCCCSVVLPGALSVLCLSLSLSLSLSLLLSLCTPSVHSLCALRRPSASYARCALLLLLLLVSQRECTETAAETERERQRERDRAQREHQGEQQSSSSSVTSSSSYLLYMFLHFVRPPSSVHSGNIAILLATHTSFVRSTCPFLAWVLTVLNR